MLKGFRYLNMVKSMDEPKILLAASKKFKNATALFPDYFDVWQAWGSVLLKLGTIYNEHHYFQEAQKKIVRAIALSWHDPPMPFPTLIGSSAWYSCV